MHNESGLGQAQEQRIMCEYQMAIYSETLKSDFEL